MELTVLIKLAIILLLLCFSAFFSGSETALFSLGAIKRQQLKEARHSRASLLNRLLERPRRLLISILVGNEIINISASAMAASLAISLFGNSGQWIALVVMTPILILFGEVLPKTIAVSRNEQFSLLVARPLSLFARAIFPLRWIIKILVDTLLSLIHSRQDGDDSIFLEEEFKELVEVGHKEGELEEEEREMIHKILTFTDTLVSSIMVPRSRMFCLPFDLGSRDLFSAVKANHFSRIPVYKNEKNNIVGVLYAKDLLTVKGKEGVPPGLRNTVLRPPYFVPHDKKISDLFKEFQNNRIHLALVVNENGNVIGLVTMEDLLEELFGEIYDEFDVELNPGGGR